MGQSEHKLQNTSKDPEKQNLGIKNGLSYEIQNIILRYDKMQCFLTSKPLRFIIE